MDEKLQRPFVFEGKDFVILPRPIKPIRGFEYTKNTKTNKKYPYCCEFHKNRKTQLKKWFVKFPNCCDHHKEIAEQWHFDKKRYVDMVDDVLEKLAYTEFVIGSKINNENWLVEISDYIEYAEFSFGHPAIGIGKYHEHLINFIEKSLAEIPKEKQTKLIELLKGTAKVDIEEYDSKLLLEIYEKWLEAFPFEISSYFGNIKEHFNNSLPIIGSEPVVNMYSGLPKAKIFTKVQFIDNLMGLTDELLTTYNAFELHKKGIIANAGKLKLEVAENKRKQKLQQGYFVKTDNDMKPFHTAIEEWFKDELEYLNVLSEELKDSKQEYQASEIKLDEVTELERTKSQKMQNFIEKYGFWELPKVNALSAEGRQILIGLIVRNGMPYAIAMFVYLEFIEHLAQEYFPTKNKLHKEISAWFGSDKDGRNVRGNINVLNPVSNESKSKFTAYLHKEIVQKDYKLLK